MIYGKLVIDSKEELNKYISDEQILTHYFGEFDAGHWYESPFRIETTASFTITFYNDKWVWRDFGIDKFPHDAIDFVQQQFGINYHTAIQKIYDEIVEGNTTFLKITKKIPKSTKKDVGLRLWKDYKDFEKEYWNQADIDFKLLINKYRVFPCEVWNNQLKLHRSKLNDPYFVYLFDKKKKIFQV